MEEDLMKKWYFALLIPSIVFAYTPSRQNSCSDLKLDTSSLGKVRNQGNISWCYAFTASDMLQYTFNTPEKISASDIATNYNKTPIGKLMDLFLNYGEPHETGFNKVALIHGMKEGYCPESVFPSEEWVKVTQDTEEKILMPEAMKQIKELHQNREKLNLENLPFYFKFKNIDKESFLSILKSKNKLKHFYTELRAKACQDDRVDFDHQWKVKMVFRNKNIFKRINSQLDLGRIVGVDYDSRVLKDAQNQSIKISSLHTSSIIGRRWDPKANTCQYLIRNSWGEKCERYDTRLECQEGNIWLNESMVFKNMTSIVYLKSKAF
jgi:hypothetical protein